MTNFDQILDRRHWHAAKWNSYDPDVLPMWVADMDFSSPQPVIQALVERVESGQFGYEFASDDLSAVLVERMQTIYEWTITPAQITYLPNLVSALNVMCRAFGGEKGRVFMHDPVYMPFLSAPTNNGQTAALVPMTNHYDGTLRYEMDFDAMEAAITPETRLFLFCNPHNPVGRVYERWELEQVAEFCLRHDLIICSDEIHCELVYEGHQHIPLASLAPEIADHCITLMSPSKTYNMPTLSTAYAISSSADLLKRFQKASAGFVPHPSGLGFAAAQAAYTQCQPWRAELLAYLTANRDYLVDYVQTHLPGIKTTCPEGTYLAWLDCRDAGIEGSPYHFFLNKARLAFNEGKTFGPAGEGFIRLNYGCPRATLTEALERMRAALAG